MDQSIEKPFDIQERTFNFGVQIIKFVDKLPHTISGTELGRQILKSGTSIDANMEEAKGAESRSDFIHKTNIAYKEARETHLWLGMMKAAWSLNSAEVNALYTESEELVRILYTILKKSRATAKSLRR
jgi:four helix bundle protein